MSRWQKLLAAMLWLLSLGVFPYLVMGAWGEHFEALPLRLLVFAGISAGGAALLRGLAPRWGWRGCLLASALSNGFVYRLAIFLPDISTYPFSLGWSEASRYYYASLFFAQRIYGVTVPLSVLHPTRYLLQAIPFIIPNTPLWLHRAWQVFLWVATTLAASLLIARRLRSSTLNSQPSSGERPFPLALVVLFAFLFLLQGPVYYHLLIVVIVILWGVEPRRFGQSLVWVLIASVWAGLSRINWFPMPGLMAAALYFLEVSFRQPETAAWLLPLRRRSALFAYLLPPAVWTVAGTALAFVAQQAYILLSGNPAEQFGSSLTSDLLWYRLLPNPTYKMGILLSIGLASLPAGVTTLAYLGRARRALHHLRLAGLAGILAVLLGGGIVVSVKIGGGSNLHNLDAFLVLLLIVGAYAFFDRLANDQGSAAAAWPPGWQGRLAWLAILPPLLFAIASGGPYPQRDAVQAQADLASLRAVVTQAVQNGGEVLFIDQRHLLTFGYLGDIPLVADYELVFLTEMGMADNAPYLARFHHELAQQRFALIVTHPLSVQFQGRSHEFGEENDAWVRHVSQPLLCYYQPALTLPEVNVSVYAPRAEPCQ